MSTCPFNKVSGIGCPFYRDRDKGDYCACLQGDCPIEGPEEEVVDTNPVVVQETRPIPPICYSADDFFDVSSKDGVELEEALLNRIWMIWDELDIRSKGQISQGCLRKIPWEALCDAGLEIFKFLVNKASYYDRD